MKNDRLPSFRALAVLAAVATLTFCSRPAAASTYTWDSGGNYGTGPTDGTGTWSVTGSNWYGLGPSDQAWVNANNDTAVFGVGSGSSTAEAISLSTAGTGIQAGGVIFNNQNYTLSSSTLTLGGTTPVVTVNTAAATINSIVAGSAGLVKSGSGLLTLGGVNVYTGGTTISRGTLQLNTNTSASSGTITLGDANTAANLAQLSINTGSSMTNAITVANLTSGTATINALGNIGTLNSAITLNGPLTITGTGTPGNPNPSPVFSGTGTLTLNVSTSAVGLLLGNVASPLFTGDIVIASGTTVEPRGMFTATTGNNTTVLGTMNIAFNNESLGALNGNGTVQGRFGNLLMTVGKSNASGTFSGTIKNNGVTLSFAKAGTGIQVLSGTDTYTGGTTISGGVLSFTNTSAVPASGSITIGSGGALAATPIYSSTASVSSWLTSGRLTANPSGAIALLNGTTDNEAITLSSTSSTLSLGAIGSATYGGALATSATTYYLGGGGGALTYTPSITGANSLVAGMGGGGSVILTASNNFTGTTTISAGTLLLGNASAALNSTVSVGSPNGLSFVAGTTAATLGGLSGGSNFVLQDGGANPVGLTVGNNGSTTTYSGNISGGGTLIKTGTGILTLSGSSGYTGGTTISQGILQLNANTSASSGTITIGDANTAANLAQLNINTGSSMTNAITVTNLSSGTAVINALGNIGTLNSAITLNGPTTIMGTGTPTAPQPNFTLAGSGAVTFNVPTSNEFIPLGSSPSFTGSATIANGTCLEPRSFFSNANGNNVTVQSGGTLQLINFGNTSIAGLYGSGVVQGRNGVGTLTVGEGNASGSFSGTMQNAGIAWLFAKTGTGTQTLSGPNIAYTGGTTLTQGTLDLANATGFASAVAMNASNNVDLQLSASSGSTWTFNQQINSGSSNASVEKVGPGTVLLAPPTGSSFVGSGSGALTVTAGSLYLTSSFSTAPAVSVGSIGTFGGSSSAAATTVAPGGSILGGYNGTGTLTLASLAYTGTGMIQGTLSATVTPIIVSGAVTASGGSASIYVTPLNSPSNGTYHFLQYGGTDPFSDFSLPTASRVLTLVDNSANKTIDISVNTGAFPIWTGLASGDWSLSTVPNPKNWVVNTGGATDFLVADTVVFDDSAGTAGGTTNVTINKGNVSPGSTTFSNNNFNYTISGSNGIASGSLTMNGTGTVTINTANSYLGGTTLSSGSLVIGNNLALGSGALNIGGGTLDMRGYNLAVSAFSGSGGLVASNGGGAATLNVSNAANATYAGLLTDNTDALGGSLAFVKSGTGTLLLTRANSFSGPTTVGSGALQLGNSASLQNSTVAINATNGLIFSAGIGTFSLGGLSGGNNESLADTGNNGVTLRIGANNASTIYSGVLSGTGGALTKTGTGMLTLGSANSYGGSTTISQGTLQLNSAFAASGSGTITLGDANTGANVAQLNLNTSSLTNAITVASTSSGSATINVLGNIASFSNAVTLNGPVTITGTGAPSNPNPSPTFSGTGTLTFNVPTSSVGLLLGNPSPSFSGDIVIASGTTVEPRGTFTAATGNNTAVYGTMYVGFADYSLGALSGTGAVDGRSGTGNHLLTVGKSNASGTFSGVMQNNGAVLSFAKSGSGTQELSGANISYTGGTTLNQGTLRLTKATNFASAVTMNSGNLVDLQLNSPLSTDNWTFNQQIAGGSTNAIIEKVGPGTVVLAPAAGSSFMGSGSGALTVTGGSLYLTGSFSTSPAVSVGALGTFGGSSSAAATTVAQGGSIVGGYNGTGTLTLASLTYAGSGTIQVALASGVTPIIVTGAVTPGGGSSSIAVTPLNAPATGTYPFLKYGGSDPFNALTLSTNVIGHSVFSLVDSSASNLIDINVTPAIPIWSGLASGDWSTNTEPGAKNWVLNVGGATDFLTGDAVVFNDSAGTAGGTTNVTINNGNVSPNTVTFSNNNYNYTISGSNGITSGSLTKNGTGMLTITNSNSYSGGTTISQGTLQLNNASAAGSGTITLGDANTGGNSVQLNMNNTGQVNNIVVSAQANSAVMNYLPTSNGFNFSGGTVTLNGPATFQAPNVTAGGNNNLQYGPVLTGSGAFTVGTTNTVRLILSNNWPSYTGDITIQNNALLEPRQSLNTIAGNNITVNAGGILQIVFGNTAINGLNGAGTVRSNGFDGGGTDTLTVGVGNGSGSFAGSLVNNGHTLALTKSGTGTQVLSGANIAYTGATTVNAGDLQLADATAFASNVTLSGGTLELNRSSGAWTLASSIGGGNGMLLKSGSGSVTLTAANSYSGGTSINLGTLQLGNSAALGAGSLTVNAGTLDMASYSSTVTGLSGIAGTIINSVPSSGGILTVNQATATSFGGIIQDAAGTVGLYKTGSGALTLTGSNAYSGGTSINSGLLQLGNSAALGTGSLSANGGTLDLAGYSTLVGSFSGTSGTIVNSASGSLATFSVNQSTATSFSGAINDGSGRVALVKSATGSLTLSGTNSYSGGTTLSDGSLVVTNAASLGASSGALSINTATLEVANGFSTSRNIMLTNDIAAIQVDAGQIYTNSGLISTPTGTGSLNKTGAGTLDITGTANIVGHANAASGLLQIDGSLTASSMNITGNAQLAGVGTISTTGDSLYFGSSTPSTFSGAIASSTQGIEIDSGSLQLSGTNNTFTGGTALSGGTLALGANNALPIATTLTFGSPVSNGTFDLAGNHQTVGGLSIAATNAPALQLIGNSSTSANAVLTFSSTGSSDFAGTIQDDLGSGTMSTALAVSGGTLELSGSNTFTGGTTVSDGTLILNNNEALADGSSLTVGEASAFSPAPVVPSLADHASMVPAPASAITAVPEPGTLLLLAALWSAMIYHRFSRRSARR